MEQPLHKIKRLSKNLPADDIKLAKQFIANREFNKLLEMIDADLYLIRQNSLLDEPKEEYLNVDIEGLYSLRDSVIEYLYFLEVPDNPEEDYEMWE